MSLPALQNRFAQLTARMPAGSNLTLLVIEAQQLHCLHGTDLPMMQQSLPIGFREFGQGPLRSTPPTPYELERAIAETEDQIMPLARKIQPATLYVICPLLASLRVGLGPMTRDQIETYFRQLAAQSEGDPLAHGLPVLDSDTAGALLILREWLHHLGFLQVFIE